MYCSWFAKKNLLDTHICKIVSRKFWALILVKFLITNYINNTRFFYVLAYSVFMLSNIPPYIYFSLRLLKMTTCTGVPGFIQLGIIKSFSFFTGWAPLSTDEDVYWVTWGGEPEMALASCLQLCTIVNMTLVPSLLWPCHLVKICHPCWEEFTLSRGQ